MECGFYIFLHTSELDNNSEFMTRLFRQLEVEGDWDCALMDISFLPTFQQGITPPLHVYVCSSMTDVSFVKDKGYQVLRRIPISTISNDAHHTFATPYYMPVTVHRLTSIAICFKDPDLEAAKLIGPVACTIHLRPRTKCQKTSEWRFPRL